ncbi:isoleucine--tRNA ligase [Rickettsia prowazekii]|uniref:Isoleucine--tRNA ligase n=2 Tax=Rickettsia prowazekii TaxID=782 RepID=SYI_RICPR|nr:isoleucine--tRNA ligase [Rickettsia prowazekii]Q9ZCU4.1 RecName: Full=Isoleucine--tRNA ligase; AltName: Full=Isoleucyl-tRNA synthetase; Short=IleRS [Rickettsia prowazekii str. Madrid E]EOB10659.1 Acetyl-CoA carboxylase, biotin carboxylase [Rickettsia prowazekii str. GvF12]ADE30156.1 Isoleucyl-tRNA synthetase [Rickettsia prowazekii str. Rp22]AFE49417.1 isoleucyl-tRNA synthetase [Rickettsia prowazekii str. Chernikova]AFE50261.1 isoleucyl-tRNA synthetase [Rickettsia prowazekii str. Katsinyian]
MTNTKYYPDVSANVDFAAIEQEILKFWQNNNIFQKSIDYRNGESEFIFYDGPPFANGLPHYGHLLTGFIKDVYARYKTIKGKKVERRFGWDCHGLPAEMQSEKELGISGRIAITNFGIEKFNNHCRASVMQYASEWEQYVTRQARWVAFKNAYKTMDKNFMESVLWAFKELYNKDLLYESMRVMPYSWACETPLSNFETRLDNAYRERTDKAITVSFVLNEVTLINGIISQKSDMKEGDNFKEYRILAWTTTPWTLPANLALAVGSDIDYAFVDKNEVCYIIAASSVAKYAKELGLSGKENFEIIKGLKLQGLSYKPLFNYFENHPNSFKIFASDFVVEGDGTGIVHMAPGFGEDDQILCESKGIELVCPVDNSGKFTKEIPDLEGVQVFDANDKIIIKLKEQGNWIKTEQYIHNYPHCWRTDTPLIYKAVPSWYVRVTKFKDRMVELNQQINWIPHNVKDNLFGKWLENARDWSISRNRFWGTPLPVWKSDDPKYPRIDVYGSIEEIEKDFGVKINDLHRPFIDELTRTNPDDPTGKSTMRRIDDVFDCWFESGSMPYGQVHYPFENKKWFVEHFPADFIVEYSSQTRGWFYTLMVLSTALFDRPPFLNCICHGVILDATGQKLSKRLNNYADPLELFDKYGSDALRVTMLSSNVVKGQELLIDKDGKMVFDTLRLFIKPIWNAYHFFTIYANADSLKGTLNFASQNVLDVYILSKLKIAVNKIEESLDNFDTQTAYHAVSEFFEVLNNWYIRRSRARFWKNEKDTDKQNAYNTLYSCLKIMTIAMSALIPMISETIYQGLHNTAITQLNCLLSEGKHIVQNPMSDTQDYNTSVHLCNYPTLSDFEINYELVSTMDNVLDICSNSLFIRSTENIRVRQPLACITIISKHNNNLKDFEDLIKDEINVKTVIYRDDLENYARKKLSLNFAILGKRLPHKMKAIIDAAKKGEWEATTLGLAICGEILNSDEYTLILEPYSHIKGTANFDNNSSLLILNLELTSELIEEGYARDIVRFIQYARKEADFSITDRILIEIISEFDLSKIIDHYGDFIKEQTLGEFAKNFTPDYVSKVALENNQIQLKVKRL